jgi:two-component sensor histidine kinase
MMNPVPLPPNQRAPAAAVQAHADLLAVVNLLDRILDAIPSMAMLLNPQRQIVLANRRLVEFAGATGAHEMFGLRLGEVLECARALESEGGCGTTPGCAACGALHATLDAQVGHADTQVCLMMRRAGGEDQALELEVSAAPVEISGQRFTLVCLSSAQNRVLRERLERGILPQAKAVANEMNALARNAADDDATEAARREALRLIEAASKRFLRLAQAHNELAAAESGRLTVARRAVLAHELLSQAAGGPEIRLDAPSEDVSVDTDPALAASALREMLLNALQAAPPERVSAGYRVSETHVEFWVNNPGEMTRAVQLQVFYRAFSTRATGRGYGAYFAKLLAERYLGGTLAFRSEAGEGTTFTLRLPRALKGQEVAHA